MLAGDFNPTTGKANDFIDVDNNYYCNLIPGDNILSPFISLPSRQNFDHNINDHGKHLLEFCKSCDLRILNGLTKGDSLGKFTYHSSKGVSTVGYVIVSNDLFASIEGFIVKQPNIFSDHSQIVCWTKIGMSN